MLRPDDSSEAAALLEETADYRPAAPAPLDPGGTTAPPMVPTIAASRSSSGASGKSPRNTQPTPAWMPPPHKVFGSVSSLASLASVPAAPASRRGRKGAPPIHPTLEERLTALRAQLHISSADPPRSQTRSTTSSAAFSAEHTVETRLSRIQVDLNNEDADDAIKLARVAAIERIIAEEAARYRDMQRRGYVQPPPQATERADRHLREPSDELSPNRERKPGSLVRVKALLPKESRGRQRSGSAPSSRSARHRVDGRREQQHPPPGNDPEPTAVKRPARLSDSDTPYIRRFGDPQALVARSVSDAKAGRRVPVFGEGGASLIA